MKKLKKAERPHPLHVNFYQEEWTAIKAEKRGTKSDYSDVVRRAVRVFFNLD